MHLLWILKTYDMRSSRYKLQQCFNSHDVQLKGTNICKNILWDQSSIHLLIAGNEIQIKERGCKFSVEQFTNNLGSPFYDEIENMLRFSATFAVTTKLLKKVERIKKVEWIKKYVRRSHHFSDTTHSTYDISDSPSQQKQMAIKYIAKFWSEK